MDSELTFISVCLILTAVIGAVIAVVLRFS